MPADRYQRFDLSRPQYLAEEHWNSIATELDRLQRSLEADDHHQTIGDLKCLVEAIAKVTWDIDGVAVPSNASFDAVVNGAHSRLAQQPGNELAYRSEFGNVATQASKIARSLGKIRNEYGAGHGRARLPPVRDEMVDLTLDGALLWSRWALRRLGYFSEGRPSGLINDLVVKPQIFSRGTLERRLEKANLALLEDHHQRAVGMAVGQRSNRGTFVVTGDGVTPCLKSDSTDSPWTVQYRMGLAEGLWFEIDGEPTIWPNDTIEDALTALDPIADCAEFFEHLVDLAVTAVAPGLPYVKDRSSVQASASFVRARRSSRPQAEAAAHDRLAEHLEQEPVGSISAD